MGEFYVDIGVRAKDGTRVKMLRAKANTGAEYTSLPGDLLCELGWEPDSADPMPWGWPFTMFYDVDAKAGKLTPRSGVRVGEVQLHIDGQDYLHSVIYGADGSDPVLGNWTVRGFVLEADEVNKCLIASELIYR